MMTGPGLALFYGGSGPPQERALHDDAELHPDGGRQHRVGGRRIQPCIRHWQRIHRRIPVRVPARWAAPVEYAATIPHTTWMVYQLMFAIITPALICGAYAERIKFSAMLCLQRRLAPGHLLPDGPHGLGARAGCLNAWNGGKINAIDFAGGTVVHISSGVSALDLCAIVLGKRRGFGEIPMPPHSVVHFRHRAALLWVGWFGFNAGSALGARSAGQRRLRSPRTSPLRPRRWDGCSSNGSKAENRPCWAQSPALWRGWWSLRLRQGFRCRCPQWSMGFAGGVACFFAATTLKHALGYDDSLDAFGVHGVGGTLGRVLTGVFAVTAVNPKAGRIARAPGQVLNQVLAAMLTWAIAAGASSLC